MELPGTPPLWRTRPHLTPSHQNSTSSWNLVILCLPPPPHPPRPLELCPHLSIMATLRSSFCWEFVASQHRQEGEEEDVSREHPPAEYHLASMFTVSWLLAYQGRACVSKSCGFAGSEERNGFCSRCSNSASTSSDTLQEYNPSSPRPSQKSWSYIKDWYLNLNGQRFADLESTERTPRPTVCWMAGSKETTDCTLMRNGIFALESLKGLFPYFPVSDN